MTELPCLCSKSRLNICAKNEPKRLRASDHCNCSNCIEIVLYNWQKCMAKPSFLIYVTLCQTLVRYFNVFFFFYFSLNFALEQKSNQFVLSIKKYLQKLLLYIRYIITYFSFRVTCFFSRLRLSRRLRAVWPRGCFACLTWVQASILWTDKG